MAKKEKGSNDIALAPQGNVLCGQNLSEAEVRALSNLHSLYSIILSDFVSLDKYHNIKTPFLVFMAAIVKDDILDRRRADQSKTR